MGFTIFLLAAGLGILYFGISRRSFDFFSTAFFSACIYFLPGFFGYTLYPSRSGDPLPVPLEQETYLVMASVLFAITSGAAVFASSRTQQHGATRPAATPHVLTAFSAALPIATACAGVGCVAAALTTGSAFLDHEKVEVMQRMNRWYILATYSAALGALYAYLRRRWVYFGMCFAILVLDVFIGFRSAIAATILSIATIAAHRRGRHRFLVRNWRLVSSAFVCALFFFGYKHVASAVKRGDWALVSETLASPDFIVNGITHSEPFTTQSILNSVIRSDFSVGLQHFAGLFQQALPFSTDLGLDSPAFNSLFQPVLFSHVTDWGMASNLWAELWSGGGWLLLLLFFPLFVWVLGMCSKALASATPEVVGSVALFGSYWAFYFHRNDVLTETSIERRVVGFALTFCAISWVLHRLKKTTWRGGPV